MKILLVADVPNWAWDYKADALINNLPQFKIKKTYSSYYRPSMVGAYDKVFFFGWNEAVGNPTRYFSSISSHNYYLLHKELAYQIIPQFRGIATVSKELYDLIKKINPNTFCCPNGVDHNLFKPVKHLEKKSFTIGWVGQKLDSNAALTGRPYDMKGYNLVLKKVIEKLEKYPDIEFKINNNNHRSGVHLTKMPEFYSDVDVQLCTSFREGTPNPLFEAASCGKALISTRVGCIPDLIKDSNNGFIVDSYSRVEECEERINTIVDHILFLKNNRDLCRDMGIRSREIIEESWTWKDRAKQYVPLFQS